MKEINENKGPDPYENRSEIDGRVDGLIGKTRLLFLPVGSGWIALAMLTDNPACTHYDEVFPNLIRELEGRGSEKNSEKPKLNPKMTGTIFETSSGSAGPSIAWIARAYGYEPFVLVPRGMRDALPGRWDAHTATLGEPIELPFGEKKADAVISLAEHGAGGLLESWYGSYDGKDHMTGMVKTVLEIYSAWDLKGRSEEMFFLNHSRRPETPAGFAATGRRLIEEVKNEKNADIDSFVGAIGNGTTIEGIAAAMREKLKGGRVIAFEPRQDLDIAANQNLVGTADLGGIAMPNVHLETYDAVIRVEPSWWTEEGKEDDLRLFNRGKRLADTVGRTTITALQIAKREILEGRSKIALVLAYDRRDRYETIVNDPEATYVGDGIWR